MPHLQVQGPRSRELLAALTDADVAGLRYFRFLPASRHDRWRRGLPGSRAPVTRASSATSSSVPPEGAEQLWQALLDQGAHIGIRPYGLAAVESLRIESGLIFIGYDYFPDVTSPFHVNLERMIKLDAADFCGREALRAEHAAGMTHGM